MYKEEGIKKRLPLMMALSGSIWKHVKERYVDAGFD